jgi:hypothetical protein
LAKISRKLGANWEQKKSGSYEEPGCFEVARRIEGLRGKGLDPFELEVLTLLERAVVLTPVELGYLEAIEKNH